MRRSFATAERDEASPEAEVTGPHDHADLEPAPLDNDFQTEFAFTLPRGYRDPSGQVHRSGVMRMATARDELVPLRDDRVRENSAYLTVVLLARVVTQIGSVTEVHPGVIEGLFAPDLAFLQELYKRINTEGRTKAQIVCPMCEHEMTVDMAGGRLGES